MQTWNNLLNYIKLNLGAPLNLLEFSDTDLVENIKEQVLPVFSQYSPCRKYTVITEKNLINHSRAGNPRFMYKIPHDFGEPIFDIHDVYFAPQNLITEDLSILLTNYTGAIDTLIQNMYLDEVRSIQVRQVWDFFPPDILSVEKELSNRDFNANSFAVIEYGTNHRDLNTINPDLYYLAFKKLALGQVMLWIAALRSKYESISSPFGQINVNYQLLQEIGGRNVEEAIQTLNNIPPDKILEVGL